MIWVNEVIELKGRIGKLVDEIWEDTTCLTAEDLPHHDKEHYKAQIIEAFKQAGGVLLSDNQEIPENPYISSGRRSFAIHAEIRKNSYAEAQEDMKEAGYKRFEEIEV